MSALHVKNELLRISERLCRLIDAVAPEWWPHSGRLRAMAKIIQHLPENRAPGQFVM
jgi:hypothetical protein